MVILEILKISENFLLLTFIISENFEFFENFGKELKILEKKLTILEKN